MRSPARPIRLNTALEETAKQATLFGRSSALTLGGNKPEKNEKMTSGSLNRLAAFTTSPDGGNPAGVWVGDTLPDSDTMQRIAAEVGFSETAFVAPRTGFDRTVRYFSPEAEVSFCGHATIATGVVLGEAGGDGKQSRKSNWVFQDVPFHAWGGVGHRSLVIGFFTDD